MVNESEKILSAFSQIYFYKELVHDSLKFIPENDTEKEVADVLLNIGDIIIAIQLKWRNDKDLTDDEQKEIKWLGKQCKNAKKQIKDSISFIQSGKLPVFKNKRNMDVKLNEAAKIVPLIIFMNDNIKTYKTIVWKHSDEGMNVNCMSFSDFKKVCETLITPIEIADYLEWRLDFYEKNGEVDTYIYEDEVGNIAISRPRNNEALVYQFLAVEYGISQATSIEKELLIFQDFLHKLPEHTQFHSEDSADFELVRFFAHFCREEIKVFVDKLDKAINKSKKKEFAVIGNMRNVQRKYIVLFLSSQYGVCIPNELIKKMIPVGMETDIILQIITYWTNNEEYSIDFCYYKYS